MLSCTDSITSGQSMSCFDYKVSNIYPIYKHY